MTEHEQLKEIIDLIGFQDKTLIYREDFKNKTFQRELMGERFIVDVREIIFTQEFMDKFNDYRYKNDIYPKEGFDLMKNLNNPVQYLYNLLGLGQEKN